MLLTARGLAVVSSLALSSGALAQNAVQWRVEDGGNGHWYQRIYEATPPVIGALNSAAIRRGAHLLTISSATENQFISTTFGDTLLGLYSASASEPFRWGNGEPVVFTNWGTSQCVAGPYPNNPPGSFRFVIIGSNCVGQAGVADAWDDLVAGDFGSAVTDFVVEWSADCDNDGQVDYGQIRNGERPDVNGNNIPDSCEQVGGPIGDAVQWRVADGGNGHWYEFVQSAVSVCWRQARDASVDAGGHLVTITTGAESQFVTTLAAPRNPNDGSYGPHIGATCEGQPWGSWYWVTGEPFAYSNWSSGEPNNAGGEQYVHLFEWQTGLRWNDFVDCGGHVRSYIVEWSADCNNDGLIDYGQIKDGQLADVNRNNTPDCCEQGLDCRANAVQWRVEDGGNGHWYAVWDLGQNFVAIEPCVSAIEALGASPCVFDDAQEWDWWRANSSGQQRSGIAHHGLYRAPHQPWRTYDGLVPPFTAWTPGLPNNPAGDYVVAMSVPTANAWEDYTSGDTGFRVWTIEWSADCNNDGVVDYGQIRAGELVDANANNIPDCCEQGTPCPFPPRQWTGTGSNGHWYSVAVNPAGDVHWRFDDAAAYAQARGAHLATFSNLQENVGVYNLLQLGSGSFAGWFGLVQAPGSTEPAGGWGWITGEPLSFTHWQPGEPNNMGCYQSSAPQNWGILEGNNAGGNLQGRWDDDGDPVPACQSMVVRAILEWSADCNGDGIVDFGQIRSGQLPDANGNNIPDSCEAITVPTDFPTVQAAIDSVPVGSQRVISVLPGTYTQSFSLNGKNVVIRGAADGTTILDGTGLPASIATFTGGEPATAGLENLVFRNGTKGSIIYKGALFKVGGAVYGRDSSAFIRNCRFEGNRSDYGGGAYLLYCNMTVEDCVFSSNTGISQGGGLMVFGTTGAVRNCSFTGNQCGIAGIGGGSAFKAAGTLNAGETVLFDGCTVTGNTSGVEGGAVEFYENVELNPGTLRIVNSTITGNRSGTGALNGAGGLMITGRMQSCIVDEGTVLCENLPRNVEGAFFIAGSPTICDCLADLNGDGVVSGGDLGLLLNAWGPTAPSGAGDVNHDGLVDGADLALMLNSWGFCP